MDKVKPVFMVIIGILAIPAFAIGWVFGAIIWHLLCTGFWQKMD